MPDIDFASFKDFGAMGVLALFIVCNTIIFVVVLRFLGEKLIPIIQNHLQHLEEAFKGMDNSLTRNTDVLEAMSEDLSMIRRRLREEFDERDK